MRVAIDPGSHHVLNLGDVAMLQVAVERLLDLWPGARIDVLTTDPEALRRHCPAATPLPAAGRYGWIPPGEPPEPPARRPAGRAARLRLRAGIALRRLEPEVRAYLETLAAADLFLLAGRGGLCDAFLDESRQVLRELDLAQQLGVPTAMVGQGLGPLADPGVRAQAAAVLPRVGMIAVRERELALRLLGELGLPPGRAEVTGDDALEPARALAPAEPAGEAIGLSVRASDYSGIGPDAVQAIGAAVRELAGRTGARIQAVPVSMYPAEADAGTFAAAVGIEDGAGVDTPRASMEAAGRCRVVVAGSYHAGVFAAAQGVPVVGVFASAYYRAKLAGLSDAFGGYGVELVEASGEGFGDRLAAALDRAYATPREDRLAMLAAADRQVDAGKAAYARLPSLVGRRAA